jgi:hypothetical protein
MARWTYAFSNGSYNDWHRKYDNIAMIDIDSIECCPQVATSHLLYLRLVMTKDKNTRLQPLQT